VSASQAESEPDCFLKKINGISWRSMGKCYGVATVKEPQMAHSPPIIAGDNAILNLAEPSQLRRISHEFRADCRDNFFAVNQTISEALVVETYPLFSGE
jgi:hypothetical protein